MNDDSQNSPSVGNKGRHQAILSNKVLACALDRLERTVKKAAVSNWVVSFLFPDKQHIFQEHLKIAE